LRAEYHGRGKGRGDEEEWEGEWRKKKGLGLFGKGAWVREFGDGRGVGVWDSMGDVGWSEKADGAMEKDFHR
jgi:hypothetical protein